MVPMYIRKDAHGKAMSIPEKKKKIHTSPVPLNE